MLHEQPHYLFVWVIFGVLRTLFDWHDFGLTLLLDLYERTLSIVVKTRIAALLTFARMLLHCGRSSSAFAILVEYRGYVLNSRSFIDFHEFVIDVHRCSSISVELPLISLCFIDLL